jgi:adenylosuccinate synthase
VYEELPGWQKPTSQVRRFQHLPYEAQRYVKRLEEIIGSPVDLISIGPRREENIAIRDFT